MQADVEYSAKHFRVLVSDNGCGIHPEVLASGRDGHWGLAGMRERAERIGGQLHVRSGESAGTEVELVVPSRLAFVDESSNGLLRLLFRFGRRRAMLEEEEDKASSATES